MLSVGTFDQMATQPLRQSQPASDPVPASLKALQQPHLQDPVHETHKPQHQVQDAIPHDIAPTNPFNPQLGVAAAQQVYQTVQQQFAQAPPQQPIVQMSHAQQRQAT